MSTLFTAGSSSIGDLGCQLFIQPATRSRQAICSEAIVSDLAENVIWTLWLTLVLVVIGAIA